MRVRVSYSGRVQGVGFRHRTRALAQEHPVVGWVRNERDGTVTLEAQGEAAAIEALLAGIEREMRTNIAAHDRIPLPDSESPETTFDILR